MKKDMIKKALLSLSIAFAATAVVGVGAVVNTNADDEATINSAFSTLALQNGASIRYAAEGEDATQEGFSYVLQMSAEQYNAVMAEDSAFSNVKFGILIGPEAYYDVHAFDNQANLDAYYSLNDEAEGKAFLYDMQATEFVGNEETVYYRGSIVEVLDANMIRDYRGVGYVEYTVDGATEKFFFTDDSNVRCPVEIADLTIDTLDAETDAATIEALKTRYINQVDWTITPDTDTDGKWYSGWGDYVFGVVAASPAPTLSWNTANRYINSKYETVYTWEKEGYESVAYGDWAAMNNLEGTWTVKGVTTCEFLTEPVVSYTRNVKFEHLYTMPGKINDVVPGGTKDGLNAARVWERGYCNGSASYDEATDTYSVTDPANWGWIVGWGQKATGDFIFDFKISGTSWYDFRIYTGNEKWVAVRTGVKGPNGFMTKVIAYASEASITGDATVFTVGDGLTLRLAMYNKTLYFFGKTHADASGAVVERDEWMHIATMSTAGLSGNNGMVYGNMASSGTAANYTAFLDAATKNEFGFAVLGVNYGYKDFKFKGNLIDDDTAVGSFINSNTTIDGAVVNGEFVANSGATAFAQDENGYWNANDPGGLKVLGKASGDYMTTFKIKSTGEIDFRLYYSGANYIMIDSAISSWGNQCVFMRSSVGGWWSETGVGYNTAKFINDNGIAAENQADGYLDLILVRQGGVYYIYSCEYLGEDGKVATFDNWQLLVQFNADKTTPVGEGIVIHNANGDVVANTNGNLSNNMVVAAATAENAFAVQCRNGAGFSAKLNIVDDDAAVAAFMASDKAVATYAKA